MKYISSTRDRGWIIVVVIPLLAVGALILFAALARSQPGVSKSDGGYGKVKPTVIYCQTPIRPGLFDAKAVERNDSYSAKAGVYVTLPDGSEHRFGDDWTDTDIQQWLASRKGVERVAVPFALKIVRPEDLRVSAVADVKLVRYERAKYTQRLAKTSSDKGQTFPSTIMPIPRSQLEVKWHQSGGMEGMVGYKSEIFGPKKRIEPKQALIPVLNRYGYLQEEWGWVRSYPDGTRFEDRLTNADTGKLFELRVAEKRDGKWLRRVVFKDESQRPKGYTGLTVTCSSCHDMAGTGNYGVGLVPGSDTVLSDPVPALEGQ